MSRIKISLFIFILLSFILAACSGVIDLPDDEKEVISTEVTQRTTSTETHERNPSPAVSEPTLTPYPRPEDIPGYYQMIPFDGIRPIYEPEFATAAESESLVLDDELVMGIAWEGEAKAYPVTVMRFREMVNDELAGIPTLVTW
ncbi:MAG: DUF3179 domain-containing protein [Gammaproteobacteria bacterium]|nr:DUF3179 domain-containing protein [Gammaproteobacteria bacterium]